MSRQPASARDRDRADAVGAGQSARSGRPSRERVAVLAAAVALVVTAVLVGPRPLALPETTTGDAALAARVHDALGSRAGTYGMAVALVTPDSVRVAGLGVRDGGDPVTADTPFAIGSVTKTMTSMLLADAVADGVVTLDTTVGEVVDELSDAPVGAVTLQELAQHRSGLPRLGGGPLWIARRFLAPVGFDPYRGWDRQDTIAAAADADLDGRDEFAYSNLGGALLGQTLARADGRSYSQALHARILQPVDMTSTVVVAHPAGLPQGRAAGVTATGVQRDPWIGIGYAPAGIGVWSTAADMGRFVQQTMTRAAPGASAARPRARIEEDQRVGLGWFTQQADGRTITWHNGATGGFASWVGFDRDTKRGVVVLSASARRVGQLGEHLLDAAPAPAATGWTLPGLPGLFLLGATALAVLFSWRAARSAWRGELADWLGLAAGFSEAIALLVLTWVAGPWTQVPWWLWSAAAAACGVAAVVAVATAWPRPLVAGSQRQWRVVRGAVQVLLTVAVVVLLFAL